MEEDAIKILEDMRIREQDPAVLTEIEACIQSGEVSPKLIRIIKRRLKVAEGEANAMRAEVERIKAERDEDLRQIEEHLKAIAVLDAMQAGLHRQDKQHLN